MNRSFLKTPFGRLLRHRSGTFGLALVLLYLVIAIFAGILAPYSPTEQHTRDRIQPPSSNYLLGTDEFGRDILSRLMHGATNSLQVSLLSVAVSGLLGTMIGILIGLFWRLGRQCVHALDGFNFLLFQPFS